MKFLNFLSIPLGRYWNIPVVIHWSLTIFLAIVAFNNFHYFLIYLAIFGIVVLHEFGHCLAALKYGIQPEDILLFPIGGVASVKIPRIPKQEFIIAVCGPVVNLLLAIPFLFLQGTQWEIIATVNLGMMFFNLIPALPMDGGRILRSALAYFGKNYVTATKISARIAQVIFLIFGGFAIYLSHIVLGIISVIMFFSAQIEISAAQIKTEPPE